jgi:hypothetical protein
MLIEVTLVGRYKLPDDLKERKAMYGTADPEACLQVDRDNHGSSELADFIHNLEISRGPVEVQLKLIPETTKEALDLVSSEDDKLNLRYS